MRKKYKLITEDSIMHRGNKLYRIQALRDIPGIPVKAGDLGGYIEGEHNLSQRGNAWVFIYAKVYGKAKIYGNAWVFGTAEVYGHTKVHGDARVYGRAKVYGTARIHGKAQVHEDAQIFGSANICDDSMVCGEDWIFNSKITNIAKKSLRNPKRKSTFF